MKSTELMIGDWVLHHNNGCIDAMNDTTPYDEAIRIERDDFELDECFWGRLDPIPITPEILEKNGFVPDNFSPYYLPIEDGSIRFSEHQYGLYCNILRSYQRYDGVCNYVHQLQHALRLAGVEKEIEL